MGKEILPFDHLEGEKIEFEVLQKLNKSLIFSEFSFLDTLYSYMVILLQYHNLLPLDAIVT